MDPALFFINHQVTKKTVACIPAVVASLDENLALSTAAYISQGYVCSDVIRSVTGIFALHSLAAHQHKQKCPAASLFSLSLSGENFFVGRERTNFFRAGYSWPLRNYSHHANSITLTTKSIIVPLRKAFSAIRQPRAVTDLALTPICEQSGENPTLVASCVSICGKKVAVSPPGSNNSGLQDVASGGCAL